MDKKLSEKELSNVSGGLGGEEAPNGHEVGCISTFYSCWGEYYYYIKTCQNCKSKNVEVDEVQHKLFCKDCKHTTYRDKKMEGIQGPKIGPING